MADVLKIYLAGAMEAYEGSNYAKEWRDEVKRYFERYSDNFACISPVDYYSYNSDISKRCAEIMRFDLRLVKKADIILVNLNNIRKSLGTSDEVLYGYIMGKPIIGFCTDIDSYATEDDIINHIHPWKYEQIDRIETGADSMIEACNYIKGFYD